LHRLGGFPLFGVATVAVFFAGWWASAEMTRGRDNHDPSQIVVDEVVGQWIALAPLSISAWQMGLPITVFWPGWITAFLAFRLFDIGKWGPVGVFDRRRDAFGVMMDDVFAGLLAAMVVLVAAALYQGVLAR
jgi:phosphatidylglycerophosphatase A